MKRGLGRRLVSLVLSAGMLLELLPMRSWAAEDVSWVEPPAEVVQEAPPAVEGEVEALRSETGKHFRLSDGSFLAVDYGMPVHYQEDGEWLDIDNRLTPVAAYGDEDSVMYTAVNGEKMTAFAADLSDGLLFATESDGIGLSMSLVDEAQIEEPPEETPSAEIAPIQDGDESILTAVAAESEEVTAPEETDALPTETDAASEEDTSMPTDAPTEEPLSTEGTEPGVPEEVTEAPTEPEASFDRTVQGQPADPEPVEADPEARGVDLETLLPEGLSSGMVYEEVYPNVDLEYQLTGYNIKESIVVKAPLERYAFTFRYRLDGLTPETQENGSVLLLDEAGEAVYEIPAPYLFDGARQVSGAAAYTVLPWEDGFLLTVEADAAWMNAPDRVFPVTIDPTLVKLSGDAQGQLSATYVEQGSPDSGHGHYQDLYFGYTSAGQKERQIYINVNSLPELPLGAVVVDASLNLWIFDYSQVNSPEMAIGAYEVTQDTSGDYSSYHNWIYYMTWNNKPKYDTANMLDYAIASEAVDDSYLSWDVTELANKWYGSGTNLHAIALAATDIESYGAGSGRYAVPAFYAYGYHPPILAVSYRNNTGLEGYYTYRTFSAGEAGTVYINDFSSQLTIAKEICSLASGVNPVSLQLVHNSAYFAADASRRYDLCQDLGMGMRVGSGCTYNFLQNIQEETVVWGESKTTYLRYLDGDGTLHYFSKKEEDGNYYDEDGLGLKIKDNGSKSYTLSDDKGNTMSFVNGLLTTIQDENKNIIRVHYNTDKGAPKGSGDKIVKITQENAGCTPLTVAAFAYNANNCVSDITDYAGNVYHFSYTSNVMLSSITRNGTKIAEYTIAKDAAGSNLSRVTGVTDSESGYTLELRYDAKGRLDRIRETVVGAATHSGALLYVSRTDSRRVTYRDYGADRTWDTEDDLLTTYAFDYAGRTVNAYTTDNAGKLVGASNAAYTAAKDDTDRRKNRMTQTASIGVAARNLGSNMGFEDGYAGWTRFNIGSTAAGYAVAIDPYGSCRTGSKCFQTWMKSGVTQTVGFYGPSYPLTGEKPTPCRPMSTPAGRCPAPMLTAAWF